MYYSLDFYPQLNIALSQGIEAIRKVYDPTADLIKPHVNIMFPATDRFDEQSLASHIEQVLESWSPFVIRLGGFHKSPDHWLFLTLLEGAGELKKLNQELYTGILAEFRKVRTDGYEPVPHIGLGLFIKKGCTYDWRNPRESDFDSERYEEALRRASALPLPSDVLVEKLHLTLIPAVLTEWTTGRRSDVPANAAMVPVREFHLGRKRSR
jgi:hypothetical protein